MNILKIIVISLCLCAMASATELAGTYTNGADGFDQKTFYVLADGRAFLGVPVKWRYDAEKRSVTVKGNLGVNLAVEERVLIYDHHKNLVVLPSSLALTAKELGFLTLEVPASIRKYLDSFDWNFEKHVIGKK